MLKKLINHSREGIVKRERLTSEDKISKDTEFYMLGMKPNTSRIMVKFFYRKKYADVLWNLVQFQEDLQVTEKVKYISLEQIKENLKVPKSNSEKINSALLAKMFEAAVYGTCYPVALLENMVRRVKTDREIEINSVRVGVIKACLNRNYKKEVFGVALDKNNTNPAYLCGRLFAVLEKIQEAASGKEKLNRTIKDAYFASASSKPGIIFPKLLKLAQNHLSKLENPVYYNKLLGEIMDKLGGEFPETLLLQDQGRFIIGYYQQNQNFYVKSEKKNDETNIMEKEGEV